MKNFKKLQYPLSLILILIGNSAYTMREEPHFTFSQNLEEDGFVVIEPIPASTTIIPPAAHMMIQHEGTITSLNDEAFPPSYDSLGYPSSVFTIAPPPRYPGVDDGTYSMIDANATVNYDNSDGDGYLTQEIAEIHNNQITETINSVDQPSLNDIKRAGKSLGKTVYQIDDKVFRICNPNDGSSNHSPPDELAKIWNKFTNSTPETRNLATAYGYSRDGNNFLVMPFIKGKDIIKKKSLIDRISGKFRDIPQSIRSEIAEMNGNIMRSLGITNGSVIMGSSHARGKIKRYNGKLLPMDMRQINLYGIYTH